MIRRLWMDEAGVIVSAELCLILTVAVLGVIVGLSEVAVAINSELNDVSNAFGAISQSFYFSGMSGMNWFDGGCKGFMAGTWFVDRIDNCDFNDSCDLVGGFPRIPAGG